MPRTTFVWAAMSVALYAAALPAEAATFVSDTTTGTQLGEFAYSGHWEHVHRNDGRGRGTSSRSDDTGAAVTLTFVGNRVRVYGVRGPGGGHGVVFLDARRYADIDFYAPAKLAQTIVFTSPSLAAGRHVITIAAVGDRRPGHRSSYINLSGAAYQ